MQSIGVSTHNVMKIPRLFVPAKDLENKIHELIKKPKSRNPEKSSYNKFDCRVIYNRAKEIAENLGKLDLTFCVYNFENENIVIEYATRWGRGKTHLRIDVKDKHSFPIVFESIHYKNSKRQKVSTYTLGEWERDLERLYKKAQQK